MLVDDNIICIKVYEAILKDAPFSCIFCQSDMEALDIIKNQKISGLITDLNMPNISGVDLIEAVNEHQEDCFKFLITGDVNLEIIMLAINELGIDQILIKPLDISAEKLKSLVLKLLNKKEKVKKVA